MVLVNVPSDGACGGRILRCPRHNRVGQADHRFLSVMMPYGTERDVVGKCAV